MKNYLISGARYIVTYNLLGMVGHNLSYRGSVVSDRGRSSVVRNRSGGSVVGHGCGCGVVRNGRGDSQLSDRRSCQELRMVVAHNTLGGYSRGGGVVLLGQETCLGDRRQSTQNYELQN